MLEGEEVSTQEITTEYPTILTFVVER
jgi:hypothetical protein